MSARQRYIIWSLICAVVAAGVYPPWAIRGVPAGYHLIFAPPAYRGPIHVDQSRLMIEWIICAVISAGLYFAWPVSSTKTPPDRSSRPSEPPTRTPREPTPPGVSLKIPAIVTLVGIAGLSLSLIPDSGLWTTKQAQQPAPTQDRDAATTAPPVQAPILIGTVKQAPPEPRPKIGYAVIQKQPEVYATLEAKPPVYATVTPSFVRPALAPNGTPWPKESAYLDGFQKRDQGGSSVVTIDNRQTNSDMSVRMFEHRENRLSRAFFIPAGQQFTMEDVSPGEYDIRYQNLMFGTLRESKPFVLTEHEERRPNADGVRTEIWAVGTTFDLTLYTVTNGNTKSENIDRKRFDGGNQ
jgi:hypothetical protein